MAKMFGLLFVEYKYSSNKGRFKNVLIMMRGEGVVEEVGDVLSWGESGTGGTHFLAECRLFGGG